MKIPSQLFVGDSASWFDSSTTDALGNEISPSAGWTLKYYIKGTADVELTATTEDGQWKTSLSTAQSTSLAAGSRPWQAKATKDAQVLTLGGGVLTVLPSLAGGYTGKSQARQDLEAVQSAMRAMISNGAVQEYSIGGRSLKKMSIESLRQLESKLLTDVKREDYAANPENGNPNTLKVKFTR